MINVYLLLSCPSPADQALSCVSCQSPNGVLDFVALGYSKERAGMLTTFLECAE